MDLHQNQTFLAWVPVISPPLLDTIWSFTLQVSIRLDGENKAVEYNAVGLTKDAVRAVFKNPEVNNLFDRNWHKIALSVEAKSVSLFLDCKHIQTLPIEEREDIDIQGKTVIGKRLYDSVPIDVSAHSCGDTRLLLVPDVKKSWDIFFGVIVCSCSCSLTSRGWWFIAIPSTQSWRLAVTYPLDLWVKYPIWVLSA